MDSHPEYGFCCHRFKIYEQKEQTFRQEYGYTYYKEGEDLEITKELYLRVWVTQMLTTLFRQNLYKVAINDCREKYHSVRDTYLYYEFLHLGKGISLNQDMGVYRWHQGGIAIGQSKISRYQIAIKVYGTLYNNNPTDKLLVPKMRYNYAHLLRYVNPSIENNHLLKNALTFCRSAKEKMLMIAVYLIPTWVILIAEKLYFSKHEVHKRI